ncbi:MAG: hypothetical protein JWO48_710 [Bryobacterales bacterium]|nr:hypothetical protein [Bryobacterales bacterium]
MSAPATCSTVASAASSSARLPISAKLLYGVGEIPITVTMVLFGLFALFFYNSVMGLPAPLVGIGIACGLVLDAVVDPYIGYRSDRAVHRMGRRHSFMLVGALAMGPCFFLLFSPPRSLGTLGLFLWLVACSMAFRVTSAVYRIPYLSLGAELAQDHDERTVVIAFRSMFGLLGTLAAAGLSFLLFFPKEMNGIDAKLNYSSYPRLGMAFGALMTLSGLVTVFGTSAYRKHAASYMSSQGHRFFSGFRLALANRAFLTIYLSFTIFFLAVVFNASLAVHYFTWYARISDGRTLSAIQVSFVLGAFAGVLFWMAMSRRSEKRTLYLAGTAATAGLLALATFLIGDGRPFGTGNALPLLIGHAVGGLFASALWVLPSSMLADIADQDELHTGLRREGIYFGLLSFGEKMASGGALLVSGLLLHFFARLTPASTVQMPSTVERLGLLYGVVPAVLLLGAVALILPYDLKRNTVREIQQTLAERKQEEHA